MSFLYMSSQSISSTPTSKIDSKYALTGFVKTPLTRSLLTYKQAV